MLEKGDTDKMQASIIEALKSALHNNPLSVNKVEEDWDSELRNLFERDENSRSLLTADLKNLCSIIQRLPQDLEWHLALPLGMVLGDTLLAGWF